MISPPIDLETIKRVLVIKLRHFGDVLLTTPVFSALQKALPNACIDAMIFKETAPMLEGHPAINAMHFCDPAWKKLSRLPRLKKEIEFLRSIRKQKYELVINLTEGDRGSIACYISNARYRVGWDPGKKGIFKKDRLYTHVVKKPNTDRHVVELNLDTLRRIGIYPEIYERKLQFYTTLHAKTRIDELLSIHRIKDYILVHPTSRWLFKSLPVKTIAQVVDRLHAMGHTIIITASSNEREIKYVQDVKKLTSNFLDLTGQINLKELGALIEHSQLFIGVDSAPMHLACALQKPVVALFGPTSEKAWGPWYGLTSSIQYIIMSHDPGCRPCGLDGCGGGKVSDCLTALTPESIVNAAFRLLSKNHYQLSIMS
ncbi:MAG: putative lipopolysaccharide heptosyltransferase III [Parachlamydiales bacterium]|nr:putative lipopolysaccharide heptosyltransferase III [Parachlamydiales bacterium]